MHLNRVGGFRRMELISPLLLYSTGVDVQKVFALLDAAGENARPEALVTGDDCATILPLLQNITAEFLKLNCPVTATSANKPVESMKTASLTYGFLRNCLLEMDGRLRDEVQYTYAFSLTHAEAALWNPSGPLLGPDVAQAFESAAFDIEEAGRCHALGRSTAAVFHAFRVLEIGIRAVAYCLDVPDLEKPALKNWGKILEGMEACIKAQWPKETDRDSGDGELFWDVYTQMTALKTPRNGTMHPARKYTEQEADRFIRIVGDIMMRLAPRLNERGEPKINVGGGPREEPAC